jgi:flagellar M-ring protein FliF
MAVPVNNGEAGSEGDAGLSAGVEDLLLLEAPQSYEKRLEYVQKLIDEDSKLVSEILKGWLRSDV